MLLAMVAGPLTADRNDDEAQNLRNLRDRIRALEAQLGETREQRDEMRDELRDFERRIGALVGGLRELDTRLARQGAQLKRLRSDARNEQKKFARHVAILEEYVRNAYFLGRQEYTKLLLSQKDPAAVARVLVYYRYLNQARLDSIQTIQSNLSHITKIQDQILVKQREMTALRETEDKNRRELESARRHRSELLALMNRRIETQSQEIGRLLSDQRRLEALIGGLRPLLREFPGADPQARFVDFRGRLPLPIDGGISARFGDPKNVGGLKWRGVFLVSPEGRRVESIFRGRVAYADWLRGFGLLLILDHGDGYMTLYGHNQSLLKQVGDWVEAGEAIALVGNTGDATRSGLYFELRHNGEPNDPLKWCRVN
jgi:septal ring factor EnvC (AmiA/AmiB activator)